MEPGARVWIADDKEGWVPGIVYRRDVLAGKPWLVCRPDDSPDEEISFPFDASIEELPEVKFMNRKEDAEVESLLSLPFLNEPSVLFCLESRFSKDVIYTLTGPILIAVNPFKPLDLYGPAILQAYRDRTATAPHLFLTADTAYSRMLGAITNNAPPDQCILISGESGAGKTESTKILLRFLTAVSSAQNVSVMDKVMESNPILEAFGNARTIRNDNSSRFGKFIDLSFGKAGDLLGGVITTYLLEKVRLCSHSKGERNYHVFYQLVAGGSDAERAHWQLPAASELHYLGQGGEARPSEHDVAGFGRLKDAMTTLRFDSRSQAAVFDVVAGLLHLGQVEFADNHNDGAELKASKAVAASLNLAAKLLGLKAEALTKAVTVKASTGRVAFEKQLSAQQAYHARDALVKSVYSLVFTRLVMWINKELVPVNPRSVKSSIGLLDIFGFESLMNNTFEQLCINYTNETLQQHFNQFIFVFEQREYESEGIKWSFIEFPNNQDSLDLIEMKGMGIFALLDDESLFPKGNDNNFAQRLYKTFDKHPKFSASHANRAAHEFCIVHYAGRVKYNTKGFVEKNKDGMTEEYADLLGRSTVPLVAELYKEARIAKEMRDKPRPTVSLLDDLGDLLGDGPASKPNSKTQQAQPKKPVLDGAKANKGAAKTVCAQFKAQLEALMRKIRAATPLYVRCLKPNDQNAPNNFNRKRVAEQLRYNGVLEALRVSRAGFPYRYSVRDFYCRYRCIANPFSLAADGLPQSVANDAQGIRSCRLLMTALLDDTSLPKVKDKFAKQMEWIRVWRGSSSVAGITEQMWQIGKTKVFLRKLPHDLLEGRRSRCLHRFVCVLQRGLRKLHSAQKLRKVIKDRIELKRSKAQLANSRGRPAPMEHSSSLSIRDGKFVGSEDQHDTRVSNEVKAPKKMAAGSSKWVFDATKVL